MFQKLMFNPVGDQRGFLTAQVKLQVKNKVVEKTVLNHQFNTNDTPETARINLKMPTSVSVAELRAIAQTMLSFADHVVEEIKAPSQGRVEQTWE